MSNETLTAKATNTEALEREPTRSGIFFRPNVDIIERVDELLVVADVPGAAADSVDVKFEDGELSIHARVKPRYADGQTFLVREYGVGDYFRTFQISEAVDATKISAEYRDGVLVLHLPKAEALKPRKIAVKAS